MSGEGSGCYLIFFKLNSSTRVTIQPRQDKKNQHGKLLKHPQYQQYPPTKLEIRDGLKINQIKFGDFFTWYLPTQQPWLLICWFLFLSSLLLGPICIDLCSQNNYFIHLRHGKIHIYRLEELQLAEQIILWLRPETQVNIQNVTGYGQLIILKYIINYLPKWHGRDRILNICILWF